MNWKDIEGSGHGLIIALPEFLDGLSKPRYMSFSTSGVPAEVPPNAERYLSTNLFGHFLSLAAGKAILSSYRNRRFVTDFTKVQKWNLF